MKTGKKILLLVTVFCGICCSAGTEIDTEVRLGDAAAEAGDFVNAAMFYDSALTLAKEDETRWPDLALKLGNARLRSGDLAGAQRLLAEYRTRFPARSAGLLPAEIMMSDGKLPEAEKFLEVVIANANDPDLSCRAQFLLAYAKIMQKNYADAVAGFEEMERENADLPVWAERAHLAAVYTLLLADEYQEADSLLKKGKYRSGNPLAYKELELLSRMRQSGDFSVFRQTWAQLLKEAGEQPGLLISELALQGAMAAEKANAAKEAENLYNQAFKLAVNDVIRKEAMLRLINLQAQSDPALAASSIGRYLEFYPDAADSFALQMRAGRLLAGAEQYADALAVYRKLMRDSRLGGAARFEASREAALAAELAGDPEKAGEILRSLIAGADSDARRSAGYYLLGEFFFRQKEYRKAAAEFRRIPAGSEKGDDARFRLLQTLMEMKAYSDAIPVAEALRNSGNQEYLITADYTRALLREKNNQSEAARSEYLKFIAAYPDSRYHAAALYRAAAIAFANREFAVAGREFLAYARKFTKSPQTPAALCYAVQAADFCGDRQLAEEAMAFLDREFPGADAAVDIRLQLAENRLMQRQWDEAENFLSGAAALGAGRNPDVAAEVLYNRARIARGKGMPEKAEAFLAELLTGYVSSAVAADAAMLRGNLAVDSGNFQFALEQFRRAAELRPSGLFGEVCKGRIADCHYALYAENMETADLKAAQAVYSELAAESVSEQLRLQSLFKLGKCGELAGAPAKALRCYDRALYLAQDLRRRGLPPDPAWSAKSGYHAIQLYLKQNSVSGTENALRVLAILEELQLPAAEDLSRIRQDIQEKFNFQEKK